MKNKFILLLITVFFLTSCSGFKLKRSEKSDEFLIEKKNPLVMPPDIDELPKPKGEVDQESEETSENFKKVLDKNSEATGENVENSNSSLKESIIKKIEE